MLTGGRLVEVRALLKKEGICLLCSEPQADHCHRRLVAEYLAHFRPELQIIHGAEAAGAVGRRAATAQSGRFRAAGKRDHLSGPGIIALV
ncbi:MAG TPA: DUF488 family protein [Candidatus Fraserbacteria bacterium]|nr:DUF488 family protein [Candidatus Fraserbacteria bacterium]